MSIIGNGGGFATSVFFISLPSTPPVNDLMKSHFDTNYSTHSLRTSLITIDKINGADDSKIVRQSKPKTSAIIQHYTRIEDIKKHNVALKLGL